MLEAMEQIPQAQQRLDFPKSERFSAFPKHNAETISPALLRTLSVLFLDSWRFMHAGGLQAWSPTWLAGRHRLARSELANSIDSKQINRGRRWRRQKSRKRWTPPQEAIPSVDPVRWQNSSQRSAKCRLKLARYRPKFPEFGQMISWIWL